MSQPLFPYQPGVRFHDEPRRLSPNARLARMAGATLLVVSAICLAASVALAPYPLLRGVLAPLWH